MVRTMNSKALHLILLTTLLILLPAAATAEGDLTIVVNNENNTALEDATVTINDGSFEDTDETNSNGDAAFTGLDAATYRVTIERDQYHTREVSVTVEDDTTTETTVILDKKDLRGDVRIHTETEAGDDLPDVDVRLASDETGYDTEKETSGGGYTVFENVPVGDYQAYLDRDSFASRQISVDVRDGKTTEYNVVMSDDVNMSRDLRISEITLPSRARPGTTATAEVTVRNNRNETARGVTVTLEAFGEEQETSSFRLDPDTSSTRTFDIDVPSDASGSEDVTVTAEDYENRHQVTTTLSLTNYRVSMQLEPETATAGSAVYVSGRVTDGSGGAGGVTANLLLDDEPVAALTTDETGRYRTYVRPDTTGIHRLTFGNDNFHISKTFRVRPKVSITDLDAPSTVNQTGEADACARIQVTDASYVTGTLVFNGRDVATETAEFDEGELCLPIPTDAHGEYTYTFLAETRDGKDTASGTISIHQTDDVTNPGISLAVNDSLSMDSGQEQYLIAALTNPTQQQYNVSLLFRNYPAGLTPTAAENLTLPANTTVERNITIRGAESGTFAGTVEIDYQGTTILSSGLTVDIRGSVEATIDRIASRLQGYGGSAYAYVRGHTEYVAAAILVIAFLILIRRRLGSKMPGPLEPKNT